jgi:hypothetical protein
MINHRFLCALGLGAMISFIGGGAIPFFAIASLLDLISSWRDLIGWSLASVFFYALIFHRYKSKEISQLTKENAIEKTPDMGDYSRWINSASGPAVTVRTEPNINEVTREAKGSVFAEKPALIKKLNEYQMSAQDKQVEVNQRDVGLGNQKHKGRKLEECSNCRTTYDHLYKDGCKRCLLCSYETFTS